MLDAPRHALWAPVEAESLEVPAALDVDGYSFCVFGVLDKVAAEQGERVFFGVGAVELGAVEERAAGFYGGFDGGKVGFV